MRKESGITAQLLDWYDTHRRSLPFRGTKDPYRVWVSEIMLQQTRVQTVALYYQRFMQRFPDVAALAQADEQEVLKLWEGLGYYSRARLLHRTARLVAAGGFPDTVDGLLALPGIGAYTAAAIASIAFDRPVPAMDGNLTRVIARLYDVAENVRIPSVARDLYAKAERLIPPNRPGDMNQALMDLGATVCLPGTPDCDLCPIRSLCAGYLAGEPEGLPILPDRKPPKPVPVAVALTTCGNRVLVVKRHEALLKNLYVFLLAEGDDGAHHAAARLGQLGIRATYGRELGTARHVFTHRVWLMRLHHFVAEMPTPVTDGQWVTAEELRALPLPTAMKAARAQALEILSKE